MLADGFTKSLGKQKHQAFCEMIGLSDEVERLVREMRMDELKDKIRGSKQQEQPDQELIIGTGVKTRGL
jgi:hypothetical protein